MTVTRLRFSLVDDSPANYNIMNPTNCFHSSWEKNRKQNINILFPLFCLAVMAHRPATIRWRSTEEMTAAAQGLVDSCRHGLFGASWPCFHLHPSFINQRKLNQRHLGHVTECPARDVSLRWGTHPEEDGCCTGGA